MLTGLQVMESTQKSPEYRRAITAMIDLLKKYAHKVEEAAKEATADVDVDDEKVQQAGRDLKEFVEKVSNKSLDPIIEAGTKVSAHSQLLVFIADTDSRYPRTSGETTNSLHTSPTSATSSNDCSISPDTQLPELPLAKPLRSTMTVNPSWPRTTGGRKMRLHCRKSSRVSSMEWRMTRRLSTSLMHSKLWGPALSTPVKSE